MVLINGKNISDEMDEIVTDLGLCPQEDILFPDLNVFEQIEFFALVRDLTLFKNLLFFTFSFFKKWFFSVEE